MMKIAITIGVASAANPMRKGFVRMQRAENVAVAETTDEMRAAAPGKLDWTTQGATTPVKDQGQCGSCWAYSATEGIESGLFMSTGILTELSEQQVISCDKTDGGCDGGDLPTAFAYVKKAGGISTESDYPDSSASSERTGSCKWDKSEAASITKDTFAIPECTGGSCKHQKESDLMAQLATNGPLSICVNANPWNSYNGGVMTASTCDGKYNDLDHCVQLVGYDNTVSKPYWKVRNSWGTSWGERGYIRLAMGTNTCGVADEAMFVKAGLDAKALVA